MKKASNIDGKWKPIESAPKGKLLLLCEVRKEESASGMLAVTKYPEKVSVGAYFDGTGWLDIQYAKRIFPTHWIELPPPPDGIDERLIADSMRESLGTSI